MVRTMFLASILITHGATTGASGNTSSAPSNSSAVGQENKAPKSHGWQQQDFIVTMWCDPPATDENLAVLERDGYNLTVVTSDSPESAIKLLDLAQKYNLKVLLKNPLICLDTLDDPAQKTKLAKLIDAVKTHPALTGYYLIDEPSATTFPDWAKLADYIKSHDPAHLAYINLYPTYADQNQLGVFLKEPPKGPLGIPDNFAGVGVNKETILFYNEHLRQYIQQLKPDLISYDHYHFLKEGQDGEQYFLNLELIRSASQNAGLPFKNIIQASTIVPSWRLPNENELRWLAYTTMAYGGRGISWFLYWGPKSYGGMYQDGKRMPHADWVAGINQEIKALGPELMKLSSTQVYHSAPLPIGTQDAAQSPIQATAGQYVIGLFREDDKTDANAFMIMNRDYKTPATANITLNMGKGTLMEFSVSKRKWIAVKPIKPGSRVKIPLVPGGGKLFKIIGN